MSIAVGIDLGTTFSVISYVNDNDEVEVISNSYGNRTTPSVVSYDIDGNIYVGEVAIEMSSNLPVENTVYVVKRSMGKNIRYKINNKEFSPEEISSEILKYLKNCAEDYLGKEITDAVITVPAYFNNDQRQSTKTAGELAGLNVLRIINEPTAASLAYGLDKKNDATVLVYDLGGGTFDVTILKLSDGCDFHVLSTAGNTALGGVDFDNIIVELALDKYKDVYRQKYDEEFNAIISENQKVRLLSVAEKVKKALSLANKSYFSLNFFGLQNNNILDISVVIERQEFEKAIEEKINLTKDCIFAAIKDANLAPQDIDEVVFVGGSTRIPIISDKIIEWLGKKPNKTINPDEAVSVGAALQAAVLSGKSNKDIFLIDVIPLSLGIETQGGVMNTMIKRNSQIPTEFVETFTTAIDNQISVDVKVFQGERPQTINNHYLGEFKIEDIPEKPRGIPKIQVTFDVDANGILTVKGYNELTNTEKTLTLTGSSSLSQDEMMKMLRDAEENKISDEIFLKISNLQSLLYDYLIQIDQLIDTKSLEKDDVDELLDLRISIETDASSQNIELLNSLVYSSKELIEKLSDKVYIKAKLLVNE
jgi:molecular chaperone DnaK